jgi:hypothetical protein
MAEGYITQTRLLNPGQIKRDPSVYDTDGFVLFNGGAPSSVISDLRTSQTTTSFRTGNLDTSSLLTGQNQLNFLMGDRSWAFQHPGDTGHTFTTTKTVDLARSKTKAWSIGGNAYALSGYIIPRGTMTLPSVPSFNETVQGQRFITSAAPTVPRANLLQSFAELAREGFAQIPGTAFIQMLSYRSGFFRSLGNEYLNIQFGWLPFMSELTSIIKSISNANKALLALEENSGKVVIRTRSTPIDSTFTSTVGTGGVVDVGTNSFNIGSSAWNAIYEGGTIGRSGATTLNQWTQQDVRFKGAFTYLLSPGTTLLSRFERYEQMANHLLGTRLNPSVLWELMPWSWLIDWFVDIQRALRTAELLSTDGLVLKYGYMTRKYIRGVERTHLIQFKGEEPSLWSRTKLETTLIRYRATPYGFGLNPNSFTSSQWAILAALGLTKAPRSLF